MATAEEIIVKLTAQNDALKAGMAEGAATVRAGTDAMAASLKNATESFAAFDAIQKTNLATAAQVAEAQRTINEVQATGAFTSEELAAKQALVDAAMLKVGKETEAASGALSAFTSNSRTMYSASALITDLMTGQFSRMRREVAALANETGLMAAAFRLALGPLGGVAAAAGAVAVMLFKGEEESSKFADSLIATGNYAGTTEGAMNDLAQSIAGGAITIGAARGVVLAFAESGRFTHDQLQLASEAAVSFASVAHVSMDEAVQAIVRIQENPVAALQKLNEQYHFVNQAQLDAVASLVKEGDTTKAVSLAIEDFGTVMHTRAMAAVQDVGYMEAAWEKLKSVISDTVNWMEQAGRKVTLQAQLEEADHDLQLIRDHGETVGRMIIGMEATGSKLFSNPANYTVDKLTAKVEGLKAQIAAANKAADDQGNATAANTTTKPHTGGGSDMSGLEQQFQEQEAAAHASYDQMKIDAADFWNAQATDAKNSAAVQADAWQKYIDARHQLDEQGLRSESEAERKGAEAARKAAEEAKQVAAGVARAKRQASDEITQEIKKEAAAQDAANLAAIQGARATALAKIETERDVAQQEYGEGAITAKQLLQIQESLTQQELAAVVTYYKAKEKLDKGNVAEVTRDATAISLALQKARQQDAKDEVKFHQNSLKEWRQYSQKVSGMVASQTSAILFQHQSLKGAVANILESMVTDWIGGEARKLAATIGFGAQETAEKETQRAANTAADIADKSAAAIRAAGLAGAQGIASFAAAPWPVDIGAPAFGAAMFAAAASFGSIASAAGGWDRVPADGVHTELHRDEMVLPKHVADPVRKMAKSGGAGGGATHFHFQSFAPRDFAAYLKRNPAALRAALGHAGRNGWTF